MKVMKCKVEVTAIRQIDTTWNVRVSMTAAEVLVTTIFISLTAMFSDALKPHGYLTIVGSALAIAAAYSVLIPPTNGVATVMVLILMRSCTICANLGLAIYTRDSKGIAVAFAQALTQAPFIVYDFVHVFFMGKAPKTTDVGRRRPYMTYNSAITSVYLFSLFACLLDDYTASALAITTLVISAYSPAIYLGLYQPCALSLVSLIVLFLSPVVLHNTWHFTLRSTISLAIMLYCDMLWLRDYVLPNAYTSSFSAFFCV